MKTLTCDSKADDTAWYFSSFCFDAKYLVVHTGSIDCRSYSYTLVPENELMITDDHQDRGFGWERLWWWHGHVAKLCLASLFTRKQWIGLNQNYAFVQHESTQTQKYYK